MMAARITHGAGVALGTLLLGWSALAAAEPACGDGRFSAPLDAGQHLGAGRVSLHNDDTQLWIHVSTAQNWCLQESHLDVASYLLGIPQTRKGEPIPGRFAWQDENLACATAQSVVLALADLGASPGTALVVAYHAVVEGQGRETAWAGEQNFPGASWARYIAYGVVGADFVSPPDGATVTGEIELAVDVEGAAVEDICGVTVMLSGGGEIPLQYAGQTDQDLPRYMSFLDTSSLDNGAYLLSAEVRTTSGTGLAHTSIQVAHPAFELTVNTGDDGETLTFCPVVDGWRSNLITVSGADEAHAVEARARVPDGEVGAWQAFMKRTSASGQVSWSGRVELAGPVDTSQILLDIRILDASGQVVFEDVRLLSTGECGEGGQQDGGSPGGDDPGTVDPGGAGL